FCVGDFRADVANDHFNGLRNVVRGVAVAVVGANHQHDDLGMDAVQLTVFDAPEDVLRAVATDAEVGGVARRVVFVPNRPAFAAPVVSDGIALEQNVNAASF